MGGSESTQDCIACRLISSAAGLGIGSYFLFEGRRTPGWGKGVYTIMGVGFGAVGCARLFNYRPSFLRD